MGAVPRRQALLHIAELATLAGDSACAAEARELAARASEGRFFVACVGQFKRGKSTLLNALLGEGVLPVGVVPVTAVVTLLRYGETRTARVMLAGGEALEVSLESLADWISEEKNPDNAKGVVTVEVTLPSPILEGGLCLVDTPGLGSVHAHNTAVARDFVPQIDAALLVLGADPPISGEELALSAEIAAQAPELLFVLAKADKQSPSELEEACAFARGVLARKLDRTARIFIVSALEALRGGSTRDWPALQNALTELRERSGAALVRSAVERGERRLATRLRRELAEQRQALTQPLADSERRLGELQTALGAADRALRDLSPLFASEHARLARAFEDARDRFLSSALPRAQAALDVELLEKARHASARDRQLVFERACELARQAFDAFRAQIEPEAEGLYRETCARFVQLANQFLARLSSEARSGGAREPSEAAAALEPIDAEQGFRVAARVYFTEMLALTGRSPLAWLAERLLPSGLRARSLRREATAYLERVLVSNAHRVGNDSIERTLESRRRLEAAIRARVGESTMRAERSLRVARAAFAAGQSAVAAELKRLDDLAAALGELETVPSPEDRHPELLRTEALRSRSNEVHHE